MASTKFLSGWYRVSGQHHFSNVKRERSGEWSADLRYSHSGDLICDIGLSTLKRDAIEEAQRHITRADDRFIPREVI